MATIATTSKASLSSPKEKGRDSGYNRPKRQDTLFGDPFELEREAPLDYQPKITEERPVENFQPTKFVTIARNDGSGFKGNGEYYFSDNSIKKEAVQVSKETPSKAPEAGDNPILSQVINSKNFILENAPGAATKTLEFAGNAMQDAAKEVLDLGKLVTGIGLEKPKQPKKEDPEKKAKEQQQKAQAMAMINQLRQDQGKVQAEQVMKETMRVIDRPTVTFQDLEMIKINNPSIDAKKVVGAYYLTEIRKAQQDKLKEAKRPKVIQSGGKTGNGPAAANLGEERAGGGHWKSAVG